MQALQDHAGKEVRLPVAAAVQVVQRERNSPVVKLHVGPVILQGHPGLPDQVGLQVFHQLGVGGLVAHPAGAGLLRVGRIYNQDRERERETIFKTVFFSNLPSE